MDFLSNLTAPFTTKAADTAANAITGTTQQGLGLARDLFSQARGAVTDYAGRAVQPLQNLSGQLSGGLQTYLDAIGANGIPGLNNARNIFNAMVQPDISRAVDITQRSGVAAGGATGNILDELARSTGRALQGNYQNFAQGLNPLLGASTGIATNLGNIFQNTGSNLAGIFGNEAGAVTSAYNRIGDAEAQAALASNQAGKNIWEGVGQGVKLAASVAPFLMAFSDERLKENMAEVGELYDGTPVYRYNYIDDPTPRIGLSAQDVEQRRPDAVAEFGGFKAVDYHRATERARTIAQRMSR